MKPIFIIVMIIIAVIIGNVTAPNKTPPAILAKAKALDGHCQTMRTGVDWFRQDIWNNRKSDSWEFQYREIAFHDFENMTVCMDRTAEGDPIFFPRFCDLEDKACILNQLDILLVTMKGGI